MLVIGAIFVDVKGFSLGTYHPEGTNIGDVQVVPGGVCRNVAEDLAHMGFEAQFVSMVDDTALGRDVKDSLSALGIDTTHVVAAPKGMGMWLAILDEHGDLRGSVSRQPDFSALEDYIKQEGETMVAACDGIVLGYDTNAAITSRMIALAERFKNEGKVISAEDFEKRDVQKLILSDELLHRPSSPIRPMDNGFDLRKSESKQAKNICQESRLQFHGLFTGDLAYSVCRKDWFQ
jgi:hypothetical protein